MEIQENDYDITGTAQEAYEVVRDQSDKSRERLIDTINKIKTVFDKIVGKEKNQDDVDEYVELLDDTGSAFDKFIRGIDILIGDIKLYGADERHLKLATICKQFEKQDFDDLNVRADSLLGRIQCYA